MCSDDNATQLEAYGAQTLMETPGTRLEWFVEDFLAIGLYILAGAPKSGKSWLSLWLGHRIACGQSIWNFATRKVGVLYLALEDNIDRIKRRLWAITDETTDDFQIVTRAGTLDDGLLDCIARQLKDFPNIRVVFIDTLAMIRGEESDHVYSADYKVMSSLKRFAEDHRIAVVVITHTRKLGDTDVFKTVTGSVGITGGADTTMVLTREGHMSPNATLDITGRDTPSRELELKFVNSVWQLVREVDAQELEERAVAPIVHATLDFMSGREEWVGTISELMDCLPETCRELPSVAAKHLAQFSDFMFERGVQMEKSRKKDGRLVRLSRIRVDDGGDGDDSK